MRHKTASALIGAGAFSIALAVLTVVAVQPALLKGPGEISLVTHSRGQAQRLDSATQQLEPVELDLMRAVSTFEVDGQTVFSGDAAAYQERLVLAEVGPDGEPVVTDANGKFIGLRAGDSVIAFDRADGTGEPGFAGVEGVERVWQTEGQTVKFPFGTDGGEGTTYDYYDQTSGRAWPVDFVRETEVDGLAVYEFSGTIPETELGQYGVLEGTTTLYSNKGRTVLVEPVTGSIVSSTTSPQTAIRFADGRIVDALLVDSLVPTPETIDDRVAEAKSSRASALALQRAPLVLGVVGVVLLLGGFLLRRRRTAAEGPSGDGSSSPGRHASEGGLLSPRSAPDSDLAEPRQRD